MTSNAAIHHDLNWLIESSDKGFYLLVASPKTQAEILSHYREPEVCVYDFREHPEGYNLGRTEDWVEAHPGAALYVLQNLQLAMDTHDRIQQLNFNRDSLHRLERNFLFCVTPSVEERLNREALDFVSYLKLKLVAEEEPEIPKPPTPPVVIDSSTGIAPPEYDLNGDRRQQLVKALAWKNQAEQLREEGRYRDALTLWEAIKTVRERFLPENHCDFAVTYHNLGSLYRVLGQYTEAELYYWKALATMGANHPEAAVTFNNLAGLYRAQGKYAEAERYYQKAILIKEKVLGKDIPSVATIYNNLAGLYKDQNRYDKAETCILKALAIQEKALGADHPNTAVTYSNLALLYNHQGKYTEAESYYLKALSALSEKNLEKGDADISAICNNLAGLYQDQGKFTKAEKYYLKALAIMERAFGNKHPHTLTTYHNLASLYEEEGDTQRAAEYRNKEEVLPSEST